jgi:ABC-type molybdate transport system permease subunit
LGSKNFGTFEFKDFCKNNDTACASGIASGAILLLARALGEFGATLMIAGQ